MADRQTSKPASNPCDYRAALLDMDGVITRTADVHARAWKRMFDEYLQRRREPPGTACMPFDIDEDYRQYVDGRPRSDGVQSFLQSRGIAIPAGDPDDPPRKETICGLGNRKNEIFQQMIETDGVEVWFDTIAQVRRWKRAGLKVGVFTSSRNCEKVLRAAGALDLFDAKVDGNDLERLELHGKPAPDMLLHAAELLRVDPAQTIVLEDSIAGVQAGRAGRFGLIVGVVRNRHPAGLQQAGADCVVEDVRDLEAAGVRRREGSDPGIPLPALERFASIAARVRGRPMALFLDYDGTLTPIVRRPEEALLPGGVRRLLSALSDRATVAIVSGRDRRDVEGMVELENLVYAGSHGFDIRGPGGLRMEQEEAQRALADLDAAEQELRERVEPIAGARVERKKFAIAVHFREVESPRDHRRIEAAVKEVGAAHPALRQRGGKKIFELQPDVPWDKGRAILWLARSLGLDRTGAAMIYIGDDVTDEDAFRVLRDRESGIGVLVSDTPRETCAAYFLRDCGEVERFLQALADTLAEESQP